MLYKTYVNTALGYWKDPSKIEFIHIPMTYNELLMATCAKQRDLLDAELARMSADPIGTFDRMTAQGWKLDLIAFIYYK